jgi:kynurenine formamidase
VTGLEFSVAGGRRWRVAQDEPVDLAVRLEFDGAQPRFFAEQPARAEPLRAGSFTGAVGLGASCNCATLTLAPHCHGTHTECVGHITDNGPTVAALTPVPPVLALLLTVQPQPLGGASGLAHATASDLVIHEAALQQAAARWSSLPWQGLVLRTLPNDPSKRGRDYSGSPSPAPWFTVAAMRWIVTRGVSSLVVDLPSLDRADDGGKLAAHRAYWGLPDGVVDGNQAARRDALVTELAYVPNDVADGLYLLDLQVPAFASDAAPSRPVLYPLRDIVGGATRVGSTAT